MVQLDRVDEEREAARASVALAHELVTPDQLKHAQALAKQGGRSMLDVLVTENVLTRSQAASIESAVSYQEVRLHDKLYARLAEKRGLVSSEHLSAGLDAQKQAFVDGKALRLGEWLVSNGLLPAQQHSMIMEAVKTVEAPVSAKQVGSVGCKKCFTPSEGNAATLTQFMRHASEDHGLGHDDVAELCGVMPSTLTTYRSTGLSKKAHDTLKANLGR